MKKSLTGSIVLFLVSLLTLSVSLFAWFLLESETRIDQIAVQVGKYDANITFLVKKNEDANYIPITTITEMEKFFSNSIPNDTFHFRITLENKSNTTLKAEIRMLEMTDGDPLNPYSLLDVFKIANNGLVVVNGVHTYPFNDVNDEAITKHGNGHVLDKHRLSNLATSSSNTRLNLVNAADANLAHDGIMTVDFSLHYDEETEDSGYEGLFFRINAFYIIMV